MKVFDNEKDTPIVGKYYNVRCAVIDRCNGSIIHVPIIGKMHNDPQFGIKEEHYHIDGRFTDCYGVSENGKTNHIIYANNDLEHIDKFKGIEIKRKKCKRLTTGIEPSLHAKKYNDWYSSYIGKSCKGRRCPHFGTLMQIVDGQLVCPLHDLRGDIDKETIIAR